MNKRKRKKALKKKEMFSPFWINPKLFRRWKMSDPDLTMTTYKIIEAYKVAAAKATLPSGTILYTPETGWIKT